MFLMPGTKLGAYEIISPLSAGGMGEVYQSKDTRLGREVAIKILPQEVAADPARKRRFAREAKIICGLNHPNICVLHDIGHQDGIDYLVMECVEGETLANRRVRWVSGAPGKPPAYAGTDFIVARNGRIASVYLFFDKLSWAELCRPWARLPLKSLTIARLTIWSKRG